MILKTLTDVLPARALIEKDIDEVTQRPLSVISIEKVRVSIVQDLQPYKQSLEIRPARIYIVKENGSRSKTKTSIVFEDNVMFFKKTKLPLESALDSTLETYSSYEVITDNGTIITFSKMKKCSCGSRLKSWSPHITYRANYSS